MQTPSFTLRMFKLIQDLLDEGIPEDVIWDSIGKMTTSGVRNAVYLRELCHRDADQDT